MHNPFKHNHPPPDSSNTAHDAKTPKSSLSNDASHEQSLHTILPTPELRSALTLLLATIATQMRTDITAIFDPRFVHFSPSQPFFGSHHPQSEGTPEKDAVVDPEQAEQAEKAAEKERERIVDQLSKPEVQALKKAVLEFYDKWRERVLTRMGEVVNSKSEAKEQVQEVEKKGETKPQETAKDEDKKLDEKDTLTDKSESKPKPKVQISEINEQAEKILPELYPPMKNELTKQLSSDQRRIVLHSIMLILLSLENYAAYTRTLLLNLCSSLEIPLSILSEDENNIACTLLTAAELSADAETKKAAEENKSSRVWKVGLATVAGAAIIGVTGGLAAPLIAAGIGEVLGGVGLASTAAAGYLGSLAESTVLIGSLFGAYGGKMTGKVMDEYAKEVEDFAFVPVRKYHHLRKTDPDYRRLRVCVGISGWLTEKDEIIKPWRVFSPTIEGFALRWELESLLRLGNSITGMLRTTAWAYAKKELIKRSVFGVLFEAIWPIKLLRVAKVIDNPFSVAMARADKAGEVLADALCNKVQGERPVTLIGYSLGARVIYSCLLELAKRKAFGLLESVVLLGMPAPADAWDWRQMRSVVAGRLVNVHSDNDLVLAFMYRTASLELGVAGLQAVQGVKGVENVDVSDIVSGHLRYRFLSGSVLKRIGFEDLDIATVEEEEAALAAMEELEEKDRKERLEKDQKENKGEDEQIKDLEKDVEKRTHDSMMDWAKAKLQLGRDAVGALWGHSDDDDDEKSDTKKETKIASHLAADKK
jgi:pimeloyl-ACP methyl ester carboxylesterase